MLNRRIYMSWYNLIDKNVIAVIPEDTAEIPEKVYSHNALLKRAALDWRR